jgi:hypothetical protein
LLFQSIMTSLPSPHPLPYPATLSPHTAPVLLPSFMIAGPMPFDVGRVVPFVVKTRKTTRVRDEAAQNPHCGISSCQPRQVPRDPSEMRLSPTFSSVPVTSTPTCWVIQRRRSSAIAARCANPTLALRSTTTAAAADGVTLGKEVHSPLYSISILYAGSAWSRDSSGASHIVGPGGVYCRCAPSVRASACKPHAAGRPTPRGGAVEVPAHTVIGWICYITQKTTYPNNGYRYGSG